MDWRILFPNNYLGFSLGAYVCEATPQRLMFMRLESYIQAVFVNKTEKGCELAAWMFCQSAMSEKLFLRQIVNRTVTVIA